MATSSKLFKQEIKQYIREQFQTNNICILDVGAGEGTYYNLLKDYFPNMYAVEIYKPNIDNFKLKDKYVDAMNMPIQEYEYSWYDLIIFGDVIEHMAIKEAQMVLEYAFDKCKEMIVAVPYKYEQGEVGGNKWEIHIQDDLTPEIMKERYPYLELLYGDNEYGYYVKRKDYKC